jgi:hypothetical protein
MSFITIVGATTVGLLVLFGLLVVIGSIIKALSD